jgi:hypothetical protein
MFTLSAVGSDCEGFMGKKPATFKRAFGVVAALLGMAVPASAIEDAYTCQSIAESFIGWDPHKKRFDANATTHLKQPAVVVLKGLNGPKPVLVAQETVPLTKVQEVEGTAWFFEVASAGTIITWTLVDRPGPSSPGHPVLTSTKTYDFFGPATFTALYRCPR